ncbi:heparinase II/III domain-containing protein [Paenibacillus sp. GYB003]|uniref:heparinase II/III domain-containing protein n=1 Tax=Paenibacillus sp. GYB003 TaxID=2994392 RepID=UPI002F96ADB5
MNEIDKTLERERGIGLIAISNKTAIIPHAVRPPVIDGILDDEVWSRSNLMDDFRTAFFHKVDPAGPEYRVAYDKTALYIGGNISREDAALLTRIEFIICTTAPGDRYYVADLPINKNVMLTNWSPHNHLDGKVQRQRVDVPAFPYETAIDESVGRLYVEAAIPLTAFGDCSVAPGDEWRINIVHIYPIGTKPLVSWVPIRTCCYVKDARAPDLYADIVNEGRWGGMFFDRLPQGHLIRPERWNMQYVGFTEKRVTMQMKPDYAHARYELEWTDPAGARRLLDHSATLTRDERPLLSFHHPEPRLNGLYELRILTYDQDPAGGYLAVFTFDRTDLIEAGEAIFVPKACKPLVQVEWARASEEVNRLLELIPPQSGMTEVGLPEKPELQPVMGLYDLSMDGRQLVAKATGTLYPNEKYPETKVVTVLSRTGKPLNFPYYEDADGNRYFLSARLWFGQIHRVMDAIGALGKTDPLGAARLLYRFAQVQDGYVPETSRVEFSSPFSFTSGPPYFVISGIWSNWYYVHLMRIEPLLHAFRQVKKTNALSLLSGEAGEDVGKAIIEQLFVPSLEFALTFPVEYGNMDPDSWRVLIAAGIVLEKPDYIHLAVERISRFMRTQFMADGFWREIALSYHIQVYTNIRKALDMLHGYSDPPGYVSARSGKRFDQLDLSLAFPILDRISRLNDALTYPNGKQLPLQDTWPSQTGRPYKEPCSLLLPSAGIGRLAIGNGSEQTQLYLMFTPKHGHDHRDPLNITFYAKGQELLPDLGYTYTNYQQFSVSTIGHNTVVVNGRDSATPTENRDGGRIERFVAEGGVFQAMRASQRSAYPEIDRYDRELWLVPLDGGDDGDGYVLDFFRVSGGFRHEYTLQGDANHDASFETSSPLSEYGPHLLPKGVKVRKPSNYHDFGNAEGHYPGYMYIRNVKHTELRGNRFMVKLVTRGSSGERKAQLKMTGLPEDGNGHLYLGRSPSLRSTRLYGGGGGGPHDNNLEAEKYEMPKLVFRREAEEGRNLRSTFVTLLEPYGAMQHPRIEAFDKLLPDAAPEGALAVRIVYGETIDIVMSNPLYPTQPLVIGDLILQGEMGLIRMRNGTICEMMLVGGTRLQKGKRQLSGSGPATGHIHGTLSRTRGDDLDALITDTPVPTTAIGKYVIVTHPDCCASGYKIGDVRWLRGQTLLVLAEHDPGFRILEDGTSVQTHFPGKRWRGAHSFTIANIEVSRTDEKL